MNGILTELALNARWRVLRWWRWHARPTLNRVLVCSALDHKATGPYGGRAVGWYYECGRCGRITSGGNYA